MSDGKPGRAELAEAVRELREEVAALRAERPVHHCHGTPCCVTAMSHPHCNWGHCGCYTFHGYVSAVAPVTAGGALPLTYYVTVGGGTNIGVNPYVTTNAAAGAPQVFTLSN